MCRINESLGFFVSQKKVWGKCVTISKLQSFSCKKKVYGKFVTLGKYWGFWWFSLYILTPQVLKIFKIDIVRVGIACRNFRLACREELTMCWIS